MAALRYYGAEYGVGRGPTGEAYAIPTKDEQLNPRPLLAIAKDVMDFLVYASEHPEHRFIVTRVGCGLAGYTDEEIAPMFKHAPSNCVLPGGWR